MAVFGFMYTTISQNIQKQMIIMKISIIIATWNAAKVLQRALDSILPQLTSECELLIIDGGSTDKTLEIIRKNSDGISFWISEKDKGIYDAWNKGIDKSHGDWIMFLGADDILLPGALDSYLNFIHKADLEGINVISSKLDLVDENGNHKRYVGEKFDGLKYGQRKCSFAHPGLLHNKSLFESYGKFTLDYKICADCEFFVRNRKNIRSAFVDRVNVRMQQGGMSVSYSAIKEAYQIRKRYHSMSQWTNLWGFITISIKLKLSAYKSFYLKLIHHGNS